jgi:hypothetical protein
MVNIYHFSFLSRREHTLPFLLHDDGSMIDLDHWCAGTSSSRLLGVKLVMALQKHFRRIEDELTVSRDRDHIAEALDCRFGYCMKLLTKLRNEQGRVVFFLLLCQPGAERIGADEHPKPKLGELDRPTLLMRRLRNRLAGIENPPGDNLINHDQVLRLTGTSGCCSDLRNEAVRPVYWSVH